MSLTGRARRRIAAVVLACTAVVAVAVIFWPDGGDPLGVSLPSERVTPVERPLSPVRQGAAEQRTAGAAAEIPKADVDSGLAVIEGEVLLTSGGGPVSEASVVVLGADPTGGLGEMLELVRTATNESGWYRVVVDPATPVVGVRVDAPGLAPVPTTLATALDPGSVVRHDIEVARIPRRRDLALTLNVVWARGGPAGDIGVHAAWQDADAPRSWSGTTDVGGRAPFTVIGLAHDGHLDIDLRKPDGRTFELWLQPRKALTELSKDVVLPRGEGTLAIEVVDDHGRRIEEPVRVKLHGWYGNPNMQQTQADYPAIDVSSGRTEVTVPAPGRYGIATVQAEGWKLDWQAQRRFNPVEPDRTTVVQVPCTPARPVTVRVATDAGPVVGAKIHYFDRNGGASGFGRTDTAGTARFMLPVQRSRLEVRAFAPGYEIAAWNDHVEHARPVDVTLRARKTDGASIVCEVQPARDQEAGIGRVVAYAYRHPRLAETGPVAEVPAHAGRFRIGGLVAGERYDVGLASAAAVSIWRRGIVAAARPGITAFGRLQPTTTTCRGRVVAAGSGATLHNVTVRLRAATGSFGFGYAQTIEAGQFGIPCPPGIYRAEIEDPEWEGWVENVTVPGEPVTIEARRRRPPGPGDRARIDLRVVDAASGEAIEGATVEFRGVPMEGEPATVPDGEPWPWSPLGVTDVAGRKLTTWWGIRRLELRVRADGYADAVSVIEPPWEPVLVQLGR